LGTEHALRGAASGHMQPRILGFGAYPRNDDLQVSTATASEPRYSPSAGKAVIDGGHLLGHEPGALAGGQEPAACQSVTTTAVATAAAQVLPGGSTAVVEVLAGGPIASDQQAQRAVARVAEQPSAATPTSLISWTSCDSAASPSVGDCSANREPGARGTTACPCARWCALLRRESRIRNGSPARENAVDRRSEVTRLDCYAPCRSCLAGRRPRVTSSDRTKADPRQE
jgi:hypothetical protein